VLHSNCSVCQPPTTSFSERPIGTIAALARMLKHPVEELRSIAVTADQRYRIGKRKRKKDGTFRICYDALGVLKSIQARIQCLILNKVSYPIYLQGCIKDPVSPRGQKANAGLHVRKRILISEDIKQFFPSVTSQVVFDIWHRFFRFSPPVAEVLTELTTKDGALPQGTKTSHLLANLVFWEHECRLVADFHRRGITYSRLIDDITCSSSRDLTTQETTWLIEALHAMVRRKGLQFNNKQDIARAADRKVATKLVVNAKTSLSMQKRSAIRAAVEQLRRRPGYTRSTEDYAHAHRHVSGQVAYMQQHHPNEAARLRRALTALRPADRPR
jgi:hypothetical protein